MRIHLLAITTLLLLAACGKDTEIDACSDEHGRFIKDVHYIQSEFLTEDKTWNYKAWNENHRKESNYEPNRNCIPRYDLNKGAEADIIFSEEDRKESLQKQIESEEETIDLRRWVRLFVLLTQP